MRAAFGRAAGLLHSAAPADFGLAGRRLRLPTVTYRFLATAGVVVAVVFVGAMLYLRHAGVSGSPQTYLYLEAGGTLISFCYAANALVRFRGTHDRTALILAFGFVLSGIIETVGYFALNSQIQLGHAASASVPMGWMVGRTLLAVVLLLPRPLERLMAPARRVPVGFPTAMLKRAAGPNGRQPAWPRLHRSTAKPG